MKTLIAGLLLISAAGVGWAEKIIKHQGIQIDTISVIKGSVLAQAHGQAEIKEDIEYIYTSSRTTPTRRR